MIRARCAWIQKLCTIQPGSNFISKSLSAQQFSRARSTPPLPTSRNLRGRCYFAASASSGCENQAVGGAASKPLSARAKGYATTTMSEGTSAKGYATTMMSEEINADVSVRACMRTAEMEFVASPINTVWRKRCVCMCVCPACK